MTAGVQGCDGKKARLMNPTHFKPPVAATSIRGASFTEITFRQIKSDSVRVVLAVTRTQNWKPSPLLYPLLLSTNSTDAYTGPHWAP